MPSPFRREEFSYLASMESEGFWLKAIALCTSETAKGLDPDYPGVSTASYAGAAVSSV